MKNSETDRACDACEIQEVRAGFWLGNLSEREIDVDRRVILKCIFKKHDGKLWACWFWLGIEASGRLFWIRECTFGFQKMRKISWLGCESVLFFFFFQEWLCGVELTFLPLLMCIVRIFNTLFATCLGERYFLECIQVKTLLVLSSSWNWNSTVIQGSVGRSVLWLVGCWVS